MKQVNFNNPGGFPLEQETLERLQIAYRSELYEALKRHLSIETDKNYIIAHATDKMRGWAVIHEPKNTGEGILYPIKIGTSTNYLKTTKTTTNLIYGDGNSQNAYTDYDAEYVSAKGTPITNEKETVNYYDLNDFVIVKDLKSIDDILKSINTKINTITSDISEIKGDVNKTKTDIVEIKDNYLPLNGSKEMKGDLNLGTHHLYLNNLSTSNSNNLLAVNDQNQVVKNNTLLDSLVRDIEELKSKIKISTAVPIGMIAMWGKPAPFPEGWEEYVPLRGRMPVGLDATQVEFNSIDKTGGSKDAVVVAHSHTVTDSGNVNNGLTGGEITNKIARWDRGSGSLLNGTVSTEGVSGQGKNLPPYKVVQFIQYTGKAPEPVDTIAPTTPGNLTVSNIASASLTLSWTASTDNVGVTNYLVYKNNSNTPFDEIGNVTTYNVKGLSTNTSYSFQIKAKDAAGNLSDSVTTNATTLSPAVPKLSGGPVGSTSVHLEWSTEDSLTYELYRQVEQGPFVLVNLPQKTDSYYSDYGLYFSTSYTYKVRIVYNGFISNYSNEFKITTPAW